MDAARELLRYGLEGTELESLIALNTEDRGDLVRGRRDRHSHQVNQTGCRTPPPPPHLPRFMSHYLIEYFIFVGILLNRGSGRLYS